MANELILVKQLPILEEKFQEKGAEIEEKVQQAKALLVTEDNYKDIKKIRATLNKEFKEYASEFRTVKEQVLEPWSRIEKAYKDNIKNKYEMADRDLKIKINEVEQGLKDEKREEIKAYYEEYAQSVGVDFVDWDRAQIKVGLSDSKKSLKEQAQKLLDGIVSDMELIESQDHKEAILAEYKICLDVNKAILTVNDRIKREEEERKAAEAREAQREAEAAHDEEVRSHFTAPEQVPQEPELSVPEKPYIAFKVYGEMDELKAVVGYLQAAGVEWEQIKA